MGFLDSIGGIVSGVGDFVAPGLGSIVGGALSYIGQGKTNKAQADLTRMQNEATARNVDETNRWNYDIAARANDSARDNAREAMAFSERMANSAYQRVTTDMRAAGINPMLAITNGGASAPQGVAAPVTTARMEAPEVRRPSFDSPLTRLGQQVGSGLSSAMDWQRKDKDMFDAELAKRQAEATQVLASASNLNSDTANKRLSNQIGNKTFDASVRQKFADVELTEAQSALSNQQKLNAAIDEITKRLGITSAKAEERRSQTDVKFYESEIGKALRAVELGGRSMGPGMDAINKALRFGR